MYDLLPPIAVAAVAGLVVAWLIVDVWQDRRRRALDDLLSVTVEEYEPPKEPGTVPSTCTWELTMRPADYPAWTNEIIKQMGWPLSMLDPVYTRVNDVCQYAYTHLDGSLSRRDLHAAGDLKASADTDGLKSKRFYEAMSLALRNAGLAEMGERVNEPARLTEKAVEEFELWSVAYSPWPSAFSEPVHPENQKISKAE